ncbi:MAG: VOC family protein [Acidimicrobiales bacterium]
MPELQLGPPSAATVVHSGLVVRVPDVDAHFAGANAEGAVIIREPSDQPYGQREHEARDPEGHRWFGTVLSD